MCGFYAAVPALWYPDAAGRAAYTSKEEKYKAKRQEWFYGIYETGLLQ